MIVVAPPLLRDYAQPVVLVGGHAAAAALLLYWARSANPRYHDQFTRFYMRVWALFFLEYLLVPLACLATDQFDVRSRTTAHRWPERRGQPSTRPGRFVGNVDCL